MRRRQRAAMRSSPAPRAMVRDNPAAHDPILCQIVDRWAVCDAPLLRNTYAVERGVRRERARHAIMRHDGEALCRDFREVPRLGRTMAIVVLAVGCFVTTLPGRRAGGAGQRLPDLLLCCRRAKVWSERIVAGPIPFAAHQRADVVVVVTVLRAEPALQSSGRGASRPRRSSLKSAAAVKATGAAEIR